MTLPIIFIGFFLLAIVLLFIKKDSTIKYKRLLIFVHICSLILLTIDIVLIKKYHTSFKTIWIDRLFAVGFFISGALIFTTYFNSLRIISKIYFGFFFTYPIIATLTFFVDRIFFAVVASPLILTLLCPNIYYSDKHFDIRSMPGIMTSNRLVLIKKDLITEKELGKSSTDFNVKDNCKIIKVISEKNDSTIILVDFNGGQESKTFIK